MAGYFAPAEAFKAAKEMIASGALNVHTIDSLRRVGVGLGLAVLFGLPIGLILGGSKLFERSAGLFFQLLRMVSPLSWMPLAVIFLGIGDAPAYFLLAFSGVWPIIINVAAGVAALDKRWITLAKSMSATKFEILVKIVLPGVVDHLLTGVRLSVGVVWIVLVPAEMLGVQSGLGYFILDARDRMAYGELVVTIVYIGFLGAALDYWARWLRRKWRRQ
jgi:NitT/TauT family transport system permease protein